MCSFTLVENCTRSGQSKTISCQNFNLQAHSQSALLTNAILGFGPCRAPKVARLDEVRDGDLVNSMLRTGSSAALHHCGRVRLGKQFQTVSGILVV